jgi:hypothetical protein
MTARGLSDAWQWLDTSELGACSCAEQLAGLSLHSPSTSAIATNMFIQDIFTHKTSSTVFTTHWSSSGYCCICHCYPCMLSFTQPVPCWVQA